MAPLRSKAEERYLGGLIRSLAVCVGLHLSLTVADLPCLQACVVSLDLKSSHTHTHTVHKCIGVFSDYCS